MNAAAHKFGVMAQRGPLQNSAAAFFIGLVLCSASFGAPAAAAEDAAQRGAGTNSQQVLVTVRTMHASEMLSESIQEAGGPVQVSIDESLLDLENKLKKLHFRKFRLLSTNEQLVPLNVEQVIELDDGHIITVRPLYNSGDRVGMWLRWVDKAGMEMLDTRMHLRPGQSVVAGTEADENCGKILAVNVMPVDRQQ